MGITLAAAEEAALGVGDGITLLGLGDSKRERGEVTAGSIFAGHLLSAAALIAQKTKINETFCSSRYSLLYSRSSFINRHL